MSALKLWGGDRFVGEYVRGLLSALVTGPRYIEQTLSAMQTLARSCLLPVSFAVGPVAAVTSLQGLQIFRLFGAEAMLASFLGTAVLREYSPALSSVMIAAQAGSSIAARIGTMKLRGELDALSMMSVDPIRYVVLPGVIACALVAPLLSIWTNVIGLAAGWLLAVPIGGVNHGAFMDHLRAGVSMVDVLVGMAKCVVFGTLIGVVAGYCGLRANKNASAVGRSANQTVLRSIVGILILDYCIGWMMLGGGLGNGWVD